MAPTIPITKSQYLVTVEGLEQYWDTFSGIKDVAQTSEYSDGLGNRTYKIVGRRNVEDVSLSKAFDPIADATILTYWQNYCQARGVDKTISVTPVKYCPEPEPLGATFILYGVKPIRLEVATADKKSGDVETLVLSFIYDSWRYQ